MPVEYAIGLDTLLTLVVIVLQDWICNRPRTNRSNIIAPIAIPDLAKLADIVLELGGNLGFRDTVICLPHPVEALTLYEAHEDICIIETPIVIRISIKWPVSVVGKYFWYWDCSCIILDKYHILCLGQGDMGSELDNYFRRYLGYLHTTPIEYGIIGAYHLFNTVWVGRFKGGDRVLDFYLRLAVHRSSLVTFFRTRHSGEGQQKSLKGLAGIR